jgi:hypothetical protein
MLGTAGDTFDAPVNPLGTELLIPRLTSVSEAHHLATILEECLPVELGILAAVMTHLESLEDHADVQGEPHYTGHYTKHYTGKPE